MILTQSINGQKINNNVILHGTIINYRNIVEVRDIGETEPLQIGDNSRTFLPDSSGKFLIEFKLDRPTYFSIARNIVYLSPGDNLEVMLDYENAENAMFKGKSCHENTYLKSTLYPLAGSFLVGGANIMPTIDQTIMKIKDLAIQKRILLHNNKKLSPQFKFLEDKRIDIDILNSIYKISSYYPYVHKLEGARLADFVNKFIPSMESIARECVSLRLNPKLLDLEVYRNILPWIQKVYRYHSNDTLQINDWLLAKKIIGEIQTTSNPDEVIAFESKIGDIKTERYREAVLASYRKFLNFTGKSAADIFIYDTKNDSIRLSSFKGKVIYIDVWATWCGPCIKELPYLDSLREHYKDDSRIIFLSLSIDTEISKWLKYVSKSNYLNLQYVTDLPMLKPYYVSEVPRAIIIDRDFKIFSLRAPAPSDPEINTIIQQIIHAD